MGFSRVGLLRAGCALAIALSAPGAFAQESPETYLKRIESIDDAGPHLNAVIALDPDAAADPAVMAAGMSAPLAGHVVLIKDNIETHDMPTTAGSLALKDNMTGRDAPLVANLRKAGAVILGKTNLSEWANFRGDRSSSGWSGVGGQTRNPYAIDRSPCGSSSGSAAAVAAGFTWAAVGTETDGSITCPASVNGIVGFKPTVGMVSRTHVVPISSSQDTAGPMARNVKDAALLLTAMAGTDPDDPATAEADAHVTDFSSGIAEASLKGVRIGVLRRQPDRLPAVTALLDRAIADMKRAGAEIVRIDYEPNGAIGDAENAVLQYEFREGIDAYLAGLPGDPPARDLAGLIAFNKAHAAQEMRWYGQETFEEALAATDSEAYEKARETARRLAGAEGIDKMLAQYGVDVLIAPTTAPAWPIDPVLGDHYIGVGAGSLAAVAGYPHLTVPMGQVERLPVGLSFIAGQWQDARVLKIGAAYERARTATFAPPSFRGWHE